MIGTYESNYVVKKYEYIDILRAIAILGVMAVHSLQGIEGLSQILSAIFNYGQLGVQLFFIASSLTLCLSATERCEKSPYNFYVRRFFRIAPLYYFGILFYFIWRFLINLYYKGEMRIPDGYSLVAILENIFFVHGFDRSNMSFIVPGGWSIAAEMAFYLIFPMLFLLVSTLRIRAFVFIAIAIAVTSFGTQYVLIEVVQPVLVEKGILSYVEKNDGFGYIYALIINQINVFLIGMVGFKLLDVNIKLGHMFLAAALMVLSCILQFNQTFDTGYDGFFYTILSSVAFVIVMIKLSKVKVPNNIFFKGLIKIGQHSYSMYIMHFMVLNAIHFIFKHSKVDYIGWSVIQLITTFLLLILITYFVATLTYKHIEQPGIQLGKKFIH